MTLPLQAQQSAVLQISDEEAPWSADRLGERLVITTSPIAVDAEDAVAAMRGCLVANLCSELSLEARFILREGTTPCLQMVVQPEEWASAIERLRTLKSMCMAASLSMDFSGALHIEKEVDEACTAEDADTQVLDLLRVLEVKAGSDAELAALLSIDEVQGAGTFEPDDEAWVIALGPSFLEHHLSLTLALAPLGDDDEAKRLLQQGLELGSALVVGPEFRIGSDPTAETLLLCTDLAPHQCDVSAIKASMGGLLLLAQRLEPLLFQGVGTVSKTDVSLLQPNLADSLSAYCIMRA